MPFVLAFPVSKTDVPETDAPEIDVTVTDVPETEEGGDGGKRDGCPRDERCVVGVLFQHYGKLYWILLNHYL